MRIKVAQTESERVTAILAYLEQRGIMAWRTNQIPVPGRAFRGRKGVSDILGIVLALGWDYSGRILCIEVKDDDGKLSPEQAKFIDDVNRCGGLAFVARSVEDVKEALVREGY